MDMRNVYVGWYNNDSGYVSMRNGPTKNLSEADIFTCSKVNAEDFELVSLYDILKNAATIASGNPWDGISLGGIFHKDDACSLINYGDVVRIETW